MTFHPVPPDENYFLKFESETGVWELGLHHVIFGVRVRAGLAGSMICVIDLCAGADVVFQFELLEAVKTILESRPEDAREIDICRLIPSYETKPIKNDPCWTKIQELVKSLSGVPPVSSPTPKTPQH